jgi:uncharacterized protein YcfL
MRSKFLIVITLFILSGCTPSKNPLRKEIKLLQKGIIKDDTSYVYALTASTPRPTISATTAATTTTPP